MLLGSAANQRSAAHVEPSQPVLSPDIARRSLLSPFDGGNSSVATSRDGGSNVKGGGGGGDGGQENKNLPGSVSISDLRSQPGRVSWLPTAVAASTLVHIIITAAKLDFWQIDIAVAAAVCVNRTRV